MLTTEEETATRAVLDVAFATAHVYEVPWQVFLLSTRLPPRISPGTLQFWVHESVQVAACLSVSMAATSLARVGFVLGRRSKQVVGKASERYAAFRGVDHDLARRMGEIEGIVHYWRVTQYDHRTNPADSPKFATGDGGSMSTRFWQGPAAPQKPVEFDTVLTEDDLLKRDDEPADAEGRIGTPRWVYVMNGGTLWKQVAPKSSDPSSWLNISDDAPSVESVLGQNVVSLKRA